MWNLKRLKIHAEGKTTSKKLKLEAQEIKRIVRKKNQMR